MSKNILLFGAGKSATCLINYLLQECSDHNWHLTVADSNLQLAQSKIGDVSRASAIGIQVENEEQRASVIKECDIVISLLPPFLHILVAVDCLKFGKDLLTASYVDENISALKEDVKKKGLLFLCETGLDPGIDHMSAMQLIHRIEASGGIITSFKSHCGGLVAPESDDNPWHYKISWNPRNVVNAGNGGAVFKEKDIVCHTKYEELFRCREVMVTGLGKLAYYPNRDSLHYSVLYGLDKAHTFMRTTLRYPEFCRSWKSIVSAGLTNGKTPVNQPGLTIKKWAENISPFVNADNKEQLFFLGLFDDTPVPAEAKTSADILQYLLETKLVMRPSDRDMIVMLHELDYELNGKKMKTESCLIVKGEDSTLTAMAKTVGLPLGITASYILQEKILLTGIQIPTIPEIYEPVMRQLNSHGIIFDDRNFQNADQF